MTVSGISDVSAYQPASAQSTFQKVKGEFEQLGQDLKAGNLSQAQADFATLSKDLPQGQQTANSQVNQDLNALSQSLQSGDVASAQKAFASVQTDLQKIGQGHHHHHHQEASTSDASSALSQDFAQLGQDLKSGDLADAQKVFSTLQGDLQKYQDNARLASATSTTTATSAINVNA